MKLALVWMTLGVLSMANSAFASESTPANTRDTATAENLFAIDLYTQVNQTAGNICVSPYGVNGALCMAAAGAVGETAHQMISVIHWTGQPTDLPAASAALNAAIVDGTSMSTDQDPQITIANAIFGQRGLPYQSHFLALLADRHGAALQEVDFSSQPRQACDHINQWAAEKTSGHIKQAVPASAITHQTRLILVDAIYFKAAWRDAFSKTGTEDDPFFLNAKDPVTVPMMNEKESFQYLENNSLQVVELPYSGDFSMVVLLPRQKDGLPALEKSLTADALNVWLTQLSPRLLQVYLPRFRLEGEYQLTGALAKLGMTAAFNPGTADFSGIVSSGKLCLDQVIHKTFISVDEEGTQAAAVTSITMRATAVRAHAPEAQPIIFRADHPFLFLLRHRSTGAIMFMGRVADPR